MTLSETSRAVEWLGQFEVDDRPAAKALLDSMLFVLGGEVIAGVRHLVEQFLQRQVGRTPVALVPVLAEEDLRDYAGEKIPRGSNPTVFGDFDPGQQLEAEPGSEALMAHLIREVKRGMAKEQFVPTPLTRDGMRDAQTRTLLCVTDYIGSGQQVADYVDAWCRNSSIRSWRSFGLMRIIVIAHVATVAGKALVEAHDGVDEVYVNEIAPSLRDACRLNPNVRNVCIRYAKRFRLSPALGHRETAGLFASSFSVPNNLPAILFRKSAGWNPFFDQRSVTASLAAELGNQRPAIDLPQRVEEAGRVRLARRLREELQDSHWRTYLAVLSLLPSSDHSLALDLGVNVEMIGAMRSALMNLELVNESGGLSDTGRRVLDRHRQKVRHVSAGLKPDDSPYYPWFKR